MQDTPGKSAPKSPAEIAREAFRQLAIRRIAPTPDAYREIYDEIAGLQEQPCAEKVLADFAEILKDGTNGLAALADQLASALKTRDWQKCGQHLTQLAEKHLTAPPKPLDKTASQPVKKESIPLVDDIEPPRSRSIPLVDDIDPPRRNRSIALVDPDMLLDKTATGELLDAENPLIGGPSHTRLMREMLVRTWTLAVVTLLHGAPDLARESEALANEIRLARSEKTLTEIEARLRQLCFRIEMKSGDLAEEHELLLRLFKLLFENMGELLEDESWLGGQMACVRDLLASPVDHTALMAATRALKDIIYKQGLLKHSLKEAKASLKNMMLTFIDRLGAIASSTGDYHEKIEQYSQQISQAKGVVELNKILDNVMQDTRVAQTDALRTRDQMIEAREEAQTADVRIHQLEAELVQMSELAYEDQLTGSLNRRGADDVLEREIARSERKKFPLCVALLDLDDFKKLNDTHGHAAGDGALVYLVRVVKETLRTMDVIARFGGEEFLIILPDTPLEEASQTVTRVQRELTKRIFMYDNKRLLITFSAGVALRKDGEDQAALITRADGALYKAKKAGKNRVVNSE